MYIGEVSKKTGLSVKAIRLYEEKGLIPKAKRLGRYRIFSQSDIELLNLIKEAKELGISLSQLKEVIVFKHDHIDWKLIYEFLEVVKLRIRVQIQELNKKIELIDQCMDQIIR